MSTNQRPGMAFNEEEIERHVQETKQQAERANYPQKPTPLHDKAQPEWPRQEDDSKEAGESESKRR
jgi:hypothetical protein